MHSAEALFARYKMTEKCEYITITEKRLYMLTAEAQNYDQNNTEIQTKWNIIKNTVKLFQLKSTTA